MSCCCVPNCKSVSTRERNADAERLGFFRIPKDPKRRKLWERLIQRTDRPLQPNDRVCSLHFPEDSVLRYSKSTLPDGTVKCLPRAKLALKADAAPIIFSDSSRIPVIEKSFPLNTGNGENAITPSTENAKKTVTQVAKNRRLTLQNEPSALQVYLRVKPTPSFQNMTEILDDYKLICTPPIQSKSFDNGEKQKFTFTKIFGPKSSQQEVFRKTLLPCVDDLIRSRNSLLFSYGTINSGKTYTIQGDIANPGLIPLTLNAIFSRIVIHEEIRYVPDMVTNVTRLSVSEGLNESQRLKNLFNTHSSMKMYETQYHHLSKSFDTYSEYQTNRLPQCSVWVSFVELYNEMIYDLLEPVTEKTRPILKLCADDNDNFYVKGLKQFCVQSAAEAYAIYMFGRDNFNVSCTMMNKTASRSHCIFIIKLINLSDPEFLTISRLTICDLAGSGKPKEARVNEWRSIDLSLFMLNRCLTTLRDNQTGDGNQTMPYRSSKLTQLLCSVLLERNDEKVIMIVNINPSAEMYDETIQVLNVSEIARQIRRNPATSAKITKQHRKYSPSRRRYSSHDSFELETLNREEERSNEIIENQSIQRQLEQLKDEVKQKEEQIEQIHNKYQEMLRYLVKFHEEEVGQIKKESQQEADQRIRAIKTFYDLKINELSSTNNTINELPQIEDSSTALEESPTRQTRQFENHHNSESNEATSARTAQDGTERPQNVFLRLPVVKSYSNPSPMNNVANRATPVLIGTSPQPNTPRQTIPINNCRVLNIKDLSGANKTLVSSGQSPLNVVRRYQIIGPVSGFKSNEPTANKIITVQAGTPAQQAMLKLKSAAGSGHETTTVEGTCTETPSNVTSLFRVVKNPVTENSSSVTQMYRLVKRSASENPSNVTSSSIQVVKTSSSENPMNLIPAFRVIRTNPTQLKVVQNSPNLPSTQVNLVGKPVTPKEPVTPVRPQNAAQQTNVVKIHQNLKLNQVGSVVGSVVSDKHILRRITATLPQKIQPVGKSVVLQMPSDNNQKEAVENNSNKDSESNKTDERRTQNAAQQSNVDGRLNSKLNQASPPVFGNSIRRTALPQKIQAIGKTVVIQMPLENNTKEAVENNSNKDSESNKTDERRKQNTSVENIIIEDCPASSPKPSNDVADQGLSTNQISNQDTSSDHFSADNPVDDDGQMNDEPQDDIRDNDDVVLISDESDHGDSYQGIDEAQLVPRSDWKNLKKFPCHYCAKSFTSGYDLRRHTNRHLDIRPFECDKCHATFIERSILKRHENDHLTKEIIAGCNLCNRSFFSTVALQKHINRTHNAMRLWKCDLCDAKFPTQASLETHLKEDLGIEPSKCEICGQELPDQVHMDKHMAEKHATEKLPEPVAERRRRRRLKKCEYCNEKFAKLKNLNCHIRRHLGMKSYKCVECYKTFVSKKALSRHTSSLHNKYKCDACDEEFSTRSELNDHRTKHSGVEPFACGICGTEFQSRARLVKHEKAHLKVKPFKCDLCGRGFASEANFEDHKGEHLGIKPHMCDICGKGFIYKAALGYHIKKHLDVEPSKRYRCTECGEEFFKPLMLKSHLNTHPGMKPLRCRVCEKKFFTYFELWNHNSVHKKDAKILYKCPKCCKNFASLLSSRDHMKRRHLARRPFRCVKCGMKFFTDHELRSHAKIHSVAKKFTRLVDGAAKSSTQNTDTFVLLESQSIHLNNPSTESYQRAESRTECTTKGNSNTDFIGHSLATPFKCSLCNKQFATVKELRLHYLVHTNPHQCAECGKRFPTQALLNIHILDRDAHAPNFQCSLCEKAFGCLRSLRLHTQRHSNSTAQRFECSTCNLKFFFRSDLDNHTGVKHLGLTLLSCAHCKKKFWDRQSLVSHIKKYHLDISSYKCTKCGEQFVNGAELERHDKTHLKPHRCSVCKKTYAFASSLELHMRIHSSDVKRYKCTQCEPVRKFFSVDNFIRHMKTHLKTKSYACNNCPKVCSSYSGFKSHSKTHLDIKSYRCKECGKMCNTYAGLYQHHRTHTKPFQCDICKRFFPLKVTLRLHIIKKHDPDTWVKC